MNSSFCSSTCSCSNFRLPKAVLRLITCVCRWDRTDSWSLAHRRCCVVNDLTPLLNLGVSNEWTMWKSLDDTSWSPNECHLSKRSWLELTSDWRREPVRFRCTIAWQPTSVEKQTKLRASLRLFWQWRYNSGHDDPWGGHTHTMQSARAEVWTRLLLST